MTIITVDTDGISGDYSSGGAALAALPDPWIDDYIITLDASTGVLDTSSLDIPNGVDTAGHSISVEAATGNEASKDGIDTLKYRNGGVQARIRNVVDGAYKNIQFVEGSNFGAMVQLVGLVAGSRAEVSGCFLKSGASTRSNQGIFVNDVDCDAVIFNNIIANPEVNMQRGIIVTNCNTALIYNNNVEGCSINGIELTAGTITVKNNASFNNTTNDILNNASATVDYNASDDGTGTNAQTPSDWTAVFADYPNDDFTLLETNDLRDNGVGPTTDSNVPTLDIDGNTRSGTTCDIGVDEFQATGGFTLTADAGTFSITGQDAGLTINRNLSAESGSLAISGQDASLKVDRVLISESGTMSISGQDAGLRIDRVLISEAGTMTITGQDADLIYGQGFILNAEAGSFSIVGQDAGLNRTYSVDSETGVMTITGQDAILVYSGEAKEYLKVINTKADLTTILNTEGDVIAVLSTKSDTISEITTKGEIG